MGSLDVTARAPEVLTGTVELEKGETFHVYCENRLSKQYPDALIRQSGNVEDLRRLLASYLTESQASPEPSIRFENMEISGPIGPLPRQQEFLGGREPVRDADYVSSVLLPLAQKAFRRPLTHPDAPDRASPSSPM